MKILISLILFCAGFCRAGEVTNSTPNTAATATNNESGVVVSEAPSDTDTQLEIPLGLWKRQLVVKYPSSMKLSVTCRVYRDGILDKTMSSRQVYGTTLPIGTEFLQLGMVDPDATNPGKSLGRVKIFGSLGPLWINKASQDSSYGCSISIPTTGAIESGKEYLVMELRYGTALLIGGSATYLPTNTSFRATLQIRGERLTAQEQETLDHQSNFSEAFKVDN